MQPRHQAHPLPPRPRQGRQCLRRAGPRPPRPVRRLRPSRMRFPLRMMQRAMPQSHVKLSELTSVLLPLPRKLQCHSWGGFACHIFLPVLHYFCRQGFGYAFPAVTKKERVSVRVRFDSFDWTNPFLYLIEYISVKLFFIAYAFEIRL